LITQTSLMKRNIEDIAEPTVYLFGVGIFSVITGLIVYLLSGKVEPMIIFITFGFIIISILLTTTIVVIREYENREKNKNNTNESKQSLFFLLFEK